MRHGMKKTQFWRKWQSMKGRCNYGDKYRHSKYYKLKGITYCDRWENFENFCDDMYASYKSHVKSYGEKDTTLDRINGNFGYSKENCRWATITEQNNNKKDNRIICVDGKCKTLTEWSKLTGLSVQCISRRIDVCRWSEYQAINNRKRTRVNKSKSLFRPVTQFNINGDVIEEFESITLAAKKIGVVNSAIRNNASGLSKTCMGFVFKYKQ